uniref:Flotillin n=3 Tax=Passerellidae TaxID=1729112 RepID=A0A8C5NLZ2_JUNHY
MVCPFSCVPVPSVSFHGVSLILPCLFGPCPLVFLDTVCSLYSVPLHNTSIYTACPFLCVPWHVPFSSFLFILLFPFFPPLSLQFAPVLTWGTPTQPSQAWQCLGTITAVLPVASPLCAHLHRGHTGGHPTSPGTCRGTPHISWVTQGTPHLCHSPQGSSTPLCSGTLRCGCRHCWCRWPGCCSWRRPRALRPCWTAPHGTASSPSAAATSPTAGPGCHGRQGAMTAWHGRSGRAASAWWGWGHQRDTGRDTGRAPLLPRHNKGDDGGDEGARGVLCGCGMGVSEGRQPCTPSTACVCSRAGRVMVSVQGDVHSVGVQRSTPGSVCTLQGTHPALHTHAVSHTHTSLTHPRTVTLSPLHTHVPPSHTAHAHTPHVTPAHAAPNMAARPARPRPRGVAPTSPRWRRPRAAPPPCEARGLVGAAGGGAVMGNCHTVGPNEALVVSGGCCGSDEKQYVYGGWAWAWWCITDTQRVSLEVLTILCRCENVETSEGVPLYVTGVAQVKIMTEKELLAVACEQFLGKNVQDVKNVVLQTLEGHLRSILGTLTVEQIYQDRDQFAKLVREVAAPDVGRMGIEILSFTIKDVYDKVDYLSSLGKTQIAAVQRDADIGVAEAERDAGIREAECKKEMLNIKFMADTKIADSKRAFELQKAAFTEEVNMKTAEAQLAYELQSAREQQKIRQEEIEIEVVERKKQIEVEEKEVLRMEKELTATVKQPAEAEAYRIQQIAEGEKVKQILLAQAEAEKIRKIGEAEAFVIEAVGMAEAEGLKLKAEALQKYGEAAQLALVLDALPEIAAKVSAPLSKVDEIVILSGEKGSTMSDVNRLLAEIPNSVRAITGVDLTKLPLFQKATEAKE